MGIGVLYNAYLQNDTSKVVICFIAAMVWGVRLLMKTIILIQPFTRHNILEALQNPAHLMATAKHIMYTGEGTSAQLMVFRVAGVMQWLVFALLSEIY